MAQGSLGYALARLGEREGGAEGVRHLAEAAEAYRRALDVFTRDHLPQDWAATQLDLGAALASLGERQGGAEGVRHLAEAAEAYRRALDVFARAESPQPWVRAQVNLGNALTSLGERQGGAEGARRLAEAVEAYRRALDVYTRAESPELWAEAQGNLGNALTSLGERQGGAEGARHLVEAVEACRRALEVHTRAHLPQDWAITQSSLGRAIQIQIRRDGFTRGLEQVGRLAQAEGLRDDPVAQAALRALALVCHVAADQQDEASRALVGLIDLIRRQPEDFRLVWDWAPLRALLAESKVPALSARRESLKKLIDAVERDNKAAILAGLEEVRGAFTTRAKGPGGPPEK
jgi:tetratricopeptide (TPR) repeat protein